MKLYQFLSLACYGSSTMQLCVLVVPLCAEMVIVGMEYKSSASFIAVQLGEFVWGNVLSSCINSNC